MLALSGTVMAVLAIDTLDAGMSSVRKFDWLHWGISLLASEGYTVIDSGITAQYDQGKNEEADYPLAGECLEQCLLRRQGHTIFRGYQVAQVIDDAR